MQCFGLSFSANVSGLGPVSPKIRKLFPKANFKIKTCWIVVQFLAHKPVSFASLTDSFIVSLSTLLKLWSWMKTQQHKIAFRARKVSRSGACFSNVPITLRPESCFMLAVFFSFFLFLFIYLFIFLNIPLLIIIFTCQLSMLSPR